MNRKVLMFGGLVVLALALSACGAAAFECDDPIGCVTYGPDETGPSHIDAEHLRGNRLPRR